MPNFHSGLRDCLLIGKVREVSIGSCLGAIHILVLFAIAAVSLNGDRASAVPVQEAIIHPVGNNDTKAPAPGVIQSLAELQTLQSTQGLKHYEIALNADLEFAASEWPFFFVGDGDARAIIECHPAVNDVLRELPFGQSLRLIGRTLTGKRQIQLRSFEILDHVKDLHPHKLTEIGPKSIPWTASLVELECTVEQVLSSKEKCVFWGRKGEVTTQIHLHHELLPSQLLAYLGKPMIAKGTLSFDIPDPGINPGNAMTIHVMHPSQLIVEGSDDGTPPPLETAEFETFKMLAGQVQFSDTRSQIIVRVGDSNLDVGTDFAGHISEGQDVSIYRRVQPQDQNALKIKSELIVVGEKNSLPNALKMDISDAIQSNYLAARIQFSATVESIEKCKDGFLMQLGSKSNVLVGKVSSKKAKVKELNFRVGDIVRIRGTPLRGHQSQTPIVGHAFKLFVSDDSDIQVIYSPVPWRTSHFAIIGVVGFGVVGTSLAWNHLLRRKVLARTAELHDASSKWKKAMEAIRKGVILTDERNRITIFNQNFVSMLGIQPQLGCAIEQTIRDISTMVTNRSDIVAAEQYAKSKVLTSRKWLLEQQWPDRTISMTSSPLVGNDGVEFRGSLWTFDDISESIRIEAELVQTQRMDAVGQLSGGIAHDFNNLLTIIRSSIQLIRDRPENIQRNIEFFNAADTAVDRAADLTQHLLDISRRSTLKKTRVDLNEFLARSFSLIRRSIDITHEIVMDLEPGKIPVDIDTTRVEQVLINLCVNARDALPANHGKIVLKSETRFNEDGTLNAILIVQDNGHGMSPEIAERIYEPFFTTKPVGAGTGLGLSMAHGIVEQHGGRISFRTAVGNGTQFEVALPIAPLVEHEVTTSPPITCSNGTPLRILLVDDEELIRSTGCAILESLGHTVLLATNGEEAIGRLEEDSCDMVILDLTMPKMSGKEAFVSIQSRWPTLPVVVCSGYPVDFVSWASQFSKQPLLLRKPFSRSNLAQITYAVSSGQ